MKDSPQSPTPLRAWKDKRRQDELAILDSLAPIDEATFLLTWELEPLSTSPRGENEPQRFWIIKHGGRVIYREPATFEGYNRFEILAQLLKEKYGSRSRI